MRNPGGNEKMMILMMNCRPKGARALEGARNFRAEPVSGKFPVFVPPMVWLSSGWALAPNNLSSSSNDPKNGGIPVTKVELRSRQRQPMRRRCLLQHFQPVA